MPKLLTNLKLDEISLVDAAANPGAKVVLFKRASPADVLLPLLATIAKDYPVIAADAAGYPVTVPISFDEALMARSLGELTDECGEYMWALRDSLTAILASDAADKAGQMRTSLAQFTAALDTTIGDWFDTTIPDDMVTKRGKTLTAEQRAILASFRHTLAALVPKTADVVPPKENEEMAKADLTKLSKAAQDVLVGLGVTELTDAQATKLEADLKPAEAEKPAAAEDVLKSAPPELRALVEKAQADVAKAQAEAEAAGKIAKAERDQRVTREFIAKAQTLDALPGMNADDFGVVLKDVAEKAPEAWAKLEPLLKSAHAAIKTGALYVEKGRGGEGGGSPFDRATAMAREKVAKNLAKTEADALGDVWKENPSLYDEYRREHSTRTSGRE